MRKIVIASVAIALMLGESGCALVGLQHVMKWSRPGGTYQQYSQDRYSCLQQAKTPVASSYANAYVGSASSGYAESAGLFTSCMGARGWVPDDNGFGPPEGGAVVNWAP